VQIAVIRATVLTAIIAVFLWLGVSESRNMVTSDGEDSYLSIGTLAVTGQVSLYQDDLTGHRMPLAFYAIGLSQALFGPNLWTARLVSVGLGLGIILVTIKVAWRLGGELAGWLAGAFLATQGALIGYYSTAAYHSLVALLLILAVGLMFDRPWLGVSVASILFFTRANMMPALAFLTVWGLWSARTRLERVAVAAIAVLPPVAFLLADSRHQKLMAYTPILRHWVEPRGYVPLLALIFDGDLGHYGPNQFAASIWSFLLLARRYESLAFAAFVLGIAWSLLAYRRTIRWPRIMWALLALWIVLSGFQTLAFGRLTTFAFRIPYVNDHAALADSMPLVALILGVSAAMLWAEARSVTGVRVLVAAGIALGLTVSVIAVRQPLLPTPVPRPFRGDTLQALDRSVTELRRLIPAGAPVFFWGHSTLTHLAGLRPPLPQRLLPVTLVTDRWDGPLVARNGMWGGAEIERWLGSESEYAVIAPYLLTQYESDRGRSVGRMRELLAARFERIGEVGGAPWPVYEVYRRLATVRTASPPGYGRVTN
jgi:4-amino-4-deoxy-L-arabinose transferase-like glycosyltransferase